MNTTSRILEGVRILAFTNGYAGPYAGRLLAQYGAEVIKIESHNKGLDTFRSYRTSESLDAAPRFIECNLCVRSVTINLKHPVGVKLVKELAGHCQAVLVNFRPQVMERLGLGDQELRSVNPGIIVLKMPGLGDTGPKKLFGSWGFNLNAFSGMTYLWNHPGQPRPVGSQGVYPDHLGFMLAPTLLMAALLHQRATGEGVSIDLAQSEATAYMLGASFLASALGQQPQPLGNHDPAAAPHGCYRCRGQERWCAISVRTEQQWQIFCRLIGQAELADDPRFCDRTARLNNASELDEIVEKWTRTRSSKEIVSQLQAQGVPAGIVQTGADLLDDPQLRHRDYFEAFTSTPVGPFEIPRSPLKFQTMVDEPLTLPSPLGADTEAILGDLLGHDKQSIERWRKEGVLR